MILLHVVLWVIIAVITMGSVYSVSRDYERTGVVTVFEICCTLSQLSGMLVSLYSIRTPNHIMFLVLCVVGFFPLLFFYFQVQRSVRLVPLFVVRLLMIEVGTRKLED